jgi:hypothetical protein
LDLREIGTCFLRNGHSNNRISGLPELGDENQGPTVVSPGRRIERQSDARASAAGSPDARGNGRDHAGTGKTGQNNNERVVRKEKCRAKSLRRATNRSQV